MPEDGLSLYINEPLFSSFPFLMVIPLTILLFWSGFDHTAARTQERRSSSSSRIHYLSPEVAVTNGFQISQILFMTILERGLLEECVVWKSKDFRFVRPTDGRVNIAVKCAPRRGSGEWLRGE